ncbi:hypothetical protein BT96DRAFT_91476 [Gymnopus androsaceus JB14]|uniref:G domain-containing protein n=1 Tax=Gymnopus androsaceus JB14 TaxID=1447944 RepID=A0A6A4GCI5_9AGAR|nr:hypothetical protein BT96DRAFT_91476 [Gymnopus androsaceus JB14]
MASSNVSEALKLRQKYKHFRVLVIGRANTGKTTLLKRVCNTDEDPCIYDEQGGNLLEPMDGRGLHDVNHPFAFKSNPEFIFHDSPGFEAGGEEELTRVREFIEKCRKATEVEDQLHAIWFCFKLDKARPLHKLEMEFFTAKHSGNVPVIAIFTQFDDLITQVMKRKLNKEMNRENALVYLMEHFQKPLEECLVPPKAYLSLEGMHENEGDAQKQVKDLMQKTANSLDDPSLKLLFVSIQKNNLELCIQYAVIHTEVEKFTLDRDIVYVLQWFRHVY